MDAALRSKVAEVFARYNFSKEDADFITEVLNGIDERKKSEFEAKMDTLLTQKDKTELTGLMQKDKTELMGLMQKDKTELMGLMQKDKTELIDWVKNVEATLTRQIYIVGLIQFLAIVGSVLAIVNFMLK